MRKKSLVIFGSYQIVAGLMLGKLFHRLTGKVTIWFYPFKTEYDMPYHVCRAIFLLGLILASINPLNAQQTAKAQVGITVPHHILASPTQNPKNQAVINSDARALMGFFIGAGIGSLLVVAHHNRDHIPSIGETVILVLGGGLLGMRLATLNES